LTEAAKGNQVVDEEFRRLASFRVLLREFHSFSEQAAQRLGLTSLQYQTLLAIKAHEKVGPMTVTVLAQDLLIKHNSAVGLIDRIEQLGLVARRHPESDRRSVVVELTARGKRVVGRLATQHRIELRRVAPRLGRLAVQFVKPAAGVA
jgi:DNA-binding MarR family transcriptional regulator